MLFIDWHHRLPASMQDSHRIFELEVGISETDRSRPFVGTTQAPENKHSIVDRQARVRFTTVMLKGEITIRHATLTDAGEIAAIHCASWRDAYANVLDPGFLSGPIEDDRRAIWSERLGKPDPKRKIGRAPV